MDSIKNGHSHINRSLYSVSCNRHRLVILFFILFYFDFFGNFNK